MWSLGILWYIIVQSLLELWKVRISTYLPVYLSSTTSGIDGHITEANEAYAIPWNRRITMGSIRVKPSKVCTNKRQRGAKQATIARHPYRSTNLLLWYGHRYHWSWRKGTLVSTYWFLLFTILVRTEQLYIIILQDFTILTLHNQFM